MSSTEWAPDLYLRFQRERTQPSIDLSRRIDLPRTDLILDAGCGPGNSTRVLADRWPDARIVGVDSSKEMIAAATADGPTGVDWVLSDLRSYQPTKSFDLVFSNAVIQWIPDQASLLASLFEMVNKGGALAVQVPMYHQMPVREAIRSVVTSDPWAGRFAADGDALTFHEAGFYYDVLSELADELTVWETRYMHEMPSSDAIVEMMSSTGLRSYLEQLGDDARPTFLDAVRAKVTKAYPEQRNGRVLFPFRRLFFIARRD